MNKSQVQECCMVISLVSWLFLSIVFVMAYYCCPVQEDDIEPLCNATGEWRQWVQQSTSYMEVLSSPMAGGLRFPLAYISFFTWFIYSITMWLITTLVELSLTNYILYPLNSMLFTCGLMMSFSPWIWANYKALSFMIKNTYHELDGIGNFCQIMSCIVFMSCFITVLMLFCTNMLGTKNGHMLNDIHYYAEFCDLVYQSFNFPYFTAFFIGLRIGIYYSGLAVILTYITIYYLAYATIVLLECVLGLLLAISLPVAIYYLIRIFRR